MMMNDYLSKGRGLADFYKIRMATDLSTIRIPVPDTGKLLVPSKVSGPVLAIFPLDHDDF